MGAKTQTDMVNKRSELWVVRQFSGGRAGAGAAKPPRDQGRKSTGTSFAFTQLRLAETERESGLADVTKNLAGTAKVQNHP